MITPPSTPGMIVPIEGAAPSSATAGESVTTEEEVPAASPVEYESPSFFLPGGYGYLPETINPGMGAYSKPAFDFTFTLQQGYNDNIYSASGETGSPIKGSPTTQGTLGMDILLAQARTFLSLGADIGGLYYWDKDGRAFSPAGHLNLLHVYKFTPRLQLTSRINSGFYSQPDLSLSNAPRPNSGDYFNLSSLFDLSYRMTPRFSTDTSAAIDTQIFQQSESKGSNYLQGTLGQALRMRISPRGTAVLEGRFSKISYNAEIRNSTTQSIMGGADFQIGPRLNGTFRGGVSFRQFEPVGAPDATSPYAEGGLGYRYGVGSVIRWDNRFGFEESNDYHQRNQSFRTSLWVNHVFTPRISASGGVTYTHEKLTDVFNSSWVDNQDLISCNLGVQYILTRKITIFANYRRSQLISDVPFTDYSRNEYYMGATYHF